MQVINNQSETKAKINSNQALSAKITKKTF